MCEDLIYIQLHRDGFNSDVLSLGQLTLRFDEIMELLEGRSKFELKKPFII